ncbi:hypothetical protein [Cellulomonas rhizosphaerae]|uniref:Uncharacterized protein n=1 Tax=Cellulomonas rhizosphaerae TaxID=2293719 RepID=A0A413RMH4_9CELL|nr:hypothetical protein [Cellulomonas rhizosphaerae]RHA41951.1 hypothetical protein D1825_08050 [Cellulomonas rhizosphaerae]
MSTDPVAALRAAAPVVSPPTPGAREAAYRAAVAQSATTVAVPSLRRWWIAGITAVAAATAAVAGTAVPALGEQGSTPDPAPAVHQPSLVAPAEIYLTRADGTVYTVTRPGSTTPENS